MKIGSVIALVGLAISFALPVFAQEKEEVDPKVLAAIQANDKAYDDAFNKHDAAGIAALFSENAVLVIRWGGGGGDSTPSPGDKIDGVFTGRAGVEKRYTALFKLRHFTDHLNTLDQVHTPFATVPWAVGGYDVTEQSAHYKGFRILTYVPAPDGKAWLVSNEIMVY
jgi:hypothetical protein